MTPTPTPYREDVEKLRAIVKSMRNKADHDMEIHWLALESFADEIDAVLSSMGSTQDARDAARYRWLRDNFMGADFQWGRSDDGGDDGTPVLLVKFDGKDVWGDLDLTVDAAMGSSPPVEPE
jgi:hypothetical protein